MRVLALSTHTDDAEMGAMVGMGAVVTKSVKAGAVVMGNPAREKTDK